MKQKTIRLFGFVFLIIGLLFLVNSFRITGFAISENLEATTVSVIGILLVIGGIVLIFTGRNGGLEEKLEVIRTSKFERAVKKHDIAEIQRAIDKIGTGLGREERMAHGPYKGEHSIRTSRGGRVLFHYRDSNKIVLDDYEPAHYRK